MTLRPEAGTSEKRPVALITGASSGLGVAFARLFARDGQELVLIARRESKLNTLADEIAASGKPRPHVIAIDLALRGACDEVAAKLDALGLEPQYVVNSAGFGLAGAAGKLGIAAQAEMVDLNMRTLTDFSLRWVDALARHRGAILNVASIAAFLPGPHIAVYHASKAYVLSLGEALAHELKDRGVRVTTLCPGPVPTEWQIRAGMDIRNFPKALVVSAERVAAEGYAALMTGKPVVIPGFANRILCAIPRFLPRATVMRLMGRGSSERSKGTA
jgi:uncharacterized protein